MLGSAFTDLLAVAQQQYKPAVIVPPRSVQSNNSNGLHIPPAPSLTVTPAVEPVSPCSSDQPLNMSIKSSICTSNTPGGNGSHLRSMLTPRLNHSATGSTGVAEPKPAHNHTSSSGTYPSSPGSSRSLSGVSTTSYTPDSPPRVLSPRTGCRTGREVPVFALHNSGMYYVPLNLSTNTMSSQMVNVLSNDNHNGNNQLQQRQPQPASNPQCHPVTIPVNFTAAANLESNFAGKHLH